MTNHISFTNKFSLLSVTNSIFITMFAKSILSVNNNYTTCRPKTCGSGPNISYPFWIEDQSPEFCGRKDFEVWCRENKPIYATSEGNYVIEEIKYEKNQIRLIDIRVVFNTTCPIPARNFSFESSLLGFLPSHADILFLSDCSKQIPINFTKISVPCTPNAPGNSFVFLIPPRMKWPEFVPCEFVVYEPVDLKEGQENESLSILDFSKLLSNGFILEWEDNECAECLSSGGFCGFNKGFVCFCTDRPHSLSCNDGKRDDSALKNNLRIILATVIPGCAVLMIVMAILTIRYRKKWKDASTTISSRNISSNPSSKSNLEGGGFFFGVPVFSYAELEEATDYFDSSRELGDGGFGAVYHGKLRDGREVAVKRLYEHNYKRVTQFRNEIEILTRLHHKNLVTLYGCTSRQSRELILVYEYISNGTVADHLHGDVAKKNPLTWHTRMNIAIETASALSYLHKSDIIHRDVKTNNILLDNDFYVKVADFGLSRLFPNDVTHVSTAPQGTPGYVDPEYYQCYQLTDKSDVYSFGVVLIELVTSMPAIDINRNRSEVNLANLAIIKIQNRGFEELIDPTIGFESDPTVERMVTSVAELAFRCLQLEKEMRPSMDEVLDSLNEIRDYKDEKDRKKMDLKPGSPEADHVVLLKTIKTKNVPISLDSVVDKWVSAHTSTSSG